MLKLHTFEPFRGTLSASPFTLKAEALLLMAGQPYERVFGTLLKMPRSKLPVLEDEGTLIPDTAFIQRHLEKKFGADFDGHLDEKQLATGLATRRLIEDHLYFINAYQRWTLHPEAVKAEYFKHVPALFRTFVFNKVAKQVRSTLHSQGLGRHTEEEMQAFGDEDWSALSRLLGDKPFLLGDEPSSFDAGLWGCLHGITACDLDIPSKRQALSHDNLTAYRARFEERFLPK
ncbi:MAG: glutathione S-transferase family protein [Pseudomonadota bacterium]